MFGTNQKGRSDLSAKKRSGRHLAARTDGFDLGVELGVQRGLFAKELTKTW
jgi:hypothetical protein